jgi:hypothetical protein
MSECNRFISEEERKREENRGALAVQRGAQARVHVCLSPVLEVMDIRLPAIAINTEMQQPPVLLAVEI